jgi:hypothetical protein
MDAGPAMRKMKDMDEILARAAEILQGYGLKVAIERERTRLGAREIDAFMRLGKGDAEKLLVAEVKPVLTPIHLAQALEHKDKGTILVARHVAPGIAEKLRTNKIPYLDLAGNVWLQDRNLLLWVEGRKRLAPPDETKTLETFNPGGLQLIFALLTNPDWVAWTTRQLAAHTRLANGTVAAGLRGLEAQGFIVRAAPRAKRRMRNLRALLDKWTEGYLQRLQMRYFLGYYHHLGADRDWWRELDPGRHIAVLGGEPAAAELTGFLTPGQITFYARMQPAKLIADKKLERDPGGKVVIRKKFWHFEAPNWRNERYAPPLLIYADLMGTGDARCVETAAKIRDQYLVRLLED